MLFTNIAHPLSMHCFEDLLQRIGNENLQQILTLLHSEWQKLYGFGPFECNRVKTCATVGASISQNPERSVCTSE